MEGKILGVPLVLILLVIGIAVLVDVPMYAMHRAEQQTNLNNMFMIREISMTVHKNVVVVPTPIVTTATPSPVLKVSVAPTKAK